MTATPPSEFGVQRPEYDYTVWRTGKAWACHARSDHEWMRRYGFESEAEARWWGEDAVEEFERNDLAYGNAHA